MNKIICNNKTIIKVYEERRWKFCIRQGGKRRILGKERKKGTNWGETGIKGREMEGKRED